MAARTSTRRPFSVLIEATGDRATARDPEGAVKEARRLLEVARLQGHRSPRANFYANGVLIRQANRTDLSDLGRRCWCGRGALLLIDDFGFCSHQHRTLWDRMTEDVKARVSVSRFIALYGKRGGE